MIRQYFQSLRGDSRAVTAVEFALIAPVFLTLVLGAFNVGQIVYGQSLLDGAVQQAARSSALETGDTAAADAQVERQVSKILPGAEVISSRVSYFDFADIGRPEQWNDADTNGTCNDGESYFDENGNEQWDADIGVEGNGGAGDVTIYSVEVVYEPFFSLFFAPDSWGETTLNSTTVRKNQPFADQAEYGREPGICT